MSSALSVLVIAADEVTGRALAEQIDVSENSQAFWQSDIAATNVSIPFESVDCILLNVDNDQINQQVQRVRDLWPSCPLWLLVKDEYLSIASPVLASDMATSCDIIRLPVPVSQMLARVRAGISTETLPDDIALADYTLHPVSKHLTTPCGDSVKLTEKETAILLFLYHNRPKVVARQTLLENVWGYNEHVTTHTLETHIYRLRQKIETDTNAMRLLVTDAGGYRLACEGVQAAS